MAAAGKVEVPPGTPCFFFDKGVKGQNDKTNCAYMSVPEDHHCYGCGAVVCDNHNINIGLMGKHKPKDHLKWEEDDE